MTKLYVERIVSDAKLPTKQNPNDSGFDVYSHSFKEAYAHYGGNGEHLVTGDKVKGLLEISLDYLERVLIGTGLKVCVDPGYEIQVRARSGLALKQGLGLTNGVGTLDSGYRGELCIIVENLSRSTQHINLGERIAQIVVCPVILPEIEVGVLPIPQDRGESGFGSTGVK